MQQDDHCILTANHVNWRITRMKGLAEVHLAALDHPGLTSIANLSQVRWDEYTAQAVKMMEQEHD